MLSFKEWDRAREQGLPESTRRRKENTSSLEAERDKSKETKSEDIADYNGSDLFEDLPGKE